MGFSRLKHDSGEMIVGADLRYLLAAVFLSLIPIIIWLHQNTQLPLADGAEPFSVAHEMYVHYQSKHIWNFVHDLYLTRGWRPTAFTLVFSPLFLLLKGNLYYAYGSMVCLISVVSTTYLYLIF